MVNNKERLDDLEAGLGLVQDELQQLSTGINDKLRGMEQMFQDSMGQMREMVSSIREGESSGSRRSRQNETPNPVAQHEEAVNPFAAQPRVPPRHIKLEFPKFQSGDPSEWMSKAKQYFSYHDMPMNQRVSFASYHLSAEANEWWQALSKARGLNPNQTSWEIFETELWTRFGPLDGENFDEALSHIRQKGSLLEFQREFERLQNKVEGWSEKALVGAFMGGLNTNISNAIRIFKPKTLTEIINLARLRDDQIQKERRWNPIRNANANSSGNQRQTLPPPTPTTEKQSLAPRKLTWEELKRKRSLGLCFSCDERYSPGHKCKQPQLFIMEGADDDDDDDSENDEEEEPTPEITLHALTGWDSPTTIRLHASIKQQSLLALVDSGSTHNFISEKVAQGLRLTETPTKPFTVRVADGNPLQCRRKYTGITIRVGDTNFSVTLYALPLAGLDLVLGVQWLASLGPVLCDWTLKTLQFDLNGKTTILTGLSTPTIRPTTQQDVEKEGRQGRLLFAICFVLEKPELQPLNDDMRDILQEFEDVFRVPDSLPPQRPIEHHINLKEGTNAINVRPYRYAYFQKDEIERQVNQMLSTGIIQPSSSPFSSPVLLVKKKDGSWRFCTDYRALNSATIKDRFPIPTVEDMLDELHGAAYFTKLDLTAGYHQVRMHPQDIHKTAFRTHSGHYEYLVMPLDSAMHRQPSKL